MYALIFKCDNLCATPRDKRPLGTPGAIDVFIRGTLHDIHVEEKPTVGSECHYHTKKKKKRSRNRQGSQ